MGSDEMLSDSRIETEEPRADHWIGTEEQLQMLWWFLAVVVVFNALDAIFTLTWVLSGQAEEANPLMSGILAVPVLFVIVKSALVNFGCHLLWLRHRHPFSVVGIFTAFYVYCAVLLHHLRLVDLEPLMRLYL
jgi:hypothetical protein